MRSFKTLCTAIGTLTILATGGLAESIVLQPTQVAVVDTENPGQALVKFSLAALREGDGRTLSQCLLTLPLSDLPSSGSEFMAYPVTATWTTVGIEDGTETAAYGDELDYWEFASGVTTGTMILSVLSAAEEWNEDSEDNFGVLIETAALSAEDLSDVLLSTRLEIQYGFLETAEN